MFDSTLPIRPKLVQCVHHTAYFCVGHGLIAGKTEEGLEQYEETLASVKKQVRMKTNGMPLNRY